jgi:hypothetical protein
MVVEGVVVVWVTALTAQADAAETNIAKFRVDRRTGSTHAALLPIFCEIVALG